jgi:hypothetical protein
VGSFLIGSEDVNWSLGRILVVASRPPPGRQRYHRRTAVWGPLDGRITAMTFNTRPALGRFGELGFAAGARCVGTKRHVPRQGLVIVRV